MKKMLAVLFAALLLMAACAWAEEAEILPSAAYETVEIQTKLEELEAIVGGRK